MKETRAMETFAEMREALRRATNENRQSREHPVMCVWCHVLTWDRDRVCEDGVCQEREAAYRRRMR